MATSEPLVPQGLPYGSRQQVEAGMERAGLPKAPTQNGAAMFIQGTRPGARPARGDFDPLREASPDDFAFLAERGGEAPAPVAQQPGPSSPPEVFARLAETAGSGFARAVAASLAARRG